MLNLNNPGNIILTSTPWIGEVYPSSHNTFKEFVSLPYGYRAMFVNLFSYFRKGYNTIDKIINRWAPAGHGNNDPEAYISYVVNQTGIPRNKELSKQNVMELKAIVAAMSAMENGTQADKQAIDEGWKLTGEIETIKKVGIGTGGLIVAGIIFLLIKNKNKK